MVKKGVCEKLTDNRMHSPVILKGRLLNNISQALIKRLLREYHPECHVSRNEISIKREIENPFYPQFWISFFIVSLVMINVFRFFADKMFGGHNRSRFEIWYPLLNGVDGVTLLFIGGVFLYIFLVFSSFPKMEVITLYDKWIVKKSTSIILKRERVDRIYLHDISDIIVSKARKKEYAFIEIKHRSYKNYFSPQLGYLIEDLRFFVNKLLNNELSINISVVDKDNLYYNKSNS